MKISTTRLETFSDGVIAIIITIMAIEIKLPDLTQEANSWEILQHLRSLVPYFITYAFSFMMIGIFWTHHHYMFHLLERTDERLLWQNFLFLFLLSLIPFGTAIVGANPFIPISAALYGILMLLTNTTFLWMRHYSLKNKLVHKDENKVLRVKIFKVSVKARTKSLIGTLVYLVAIPLAFVNVYFSYLCYTIPPIIYFIPDGIDDEKLAEQVEEKNS